MTDDRDTPVPPPTQHPPVRVEDPHRPASEHFRQVRRELAATPVAGTPAVDEHAQQLQRARDVRMRAWFELLEVERDATDPQVAKLAGVLRRLLGPTHGPP